MKHGDTLKPSLASPETCTGCMACADACRQGALQMTMQADGHWYPSVDAKACVGCGVCEKACPIQNNLQYSSCSGKSAPFAAWATNKELISKSASGGVFAALAAYILSNGGYVVGAVSQGQKVRHVVIESIDDLHLLQGTKYLHSITSGVYRQVKQLLVAGKTVLFSGTGCQVGGLLQFLGGKKYENLFTVDLICAGVPSSLVMTRYCEEENITPQSIRWRDKERGWQHGLQLTVNTEKGVLKPKTATSFFGGGFLGGLTSRWSCYNCLFTGSDRLSDFTIGDYWSPPRKTQKQWRDGLSVMIVHSAAGREILEKCQIAAEPTTWRECTAGNPRILLGYRPMHWAFIERRLLPWSFKHLGYGTLKKIYAGGIRKNDFLWLPYKILKFLRWKLSQRLIRKRIDNILKNL